MSLSYLLQSLSSQLVPLAFVFPRITDLLHN
uniref:Uncharacterized protein n=1 Tax=Rhizophora mucronata TaxID=61149 RepID=A0A2P2QLM8_RHIMU